MPAGTRFLPSTISRRFLEQEALHLSVGFAMVLPFRDSKGQQKLRQKVPKPSHLSLSKNDVFFGWVLNKSKKNWRAPLGNEAIWLYGYDGDLIPSFNSWFTRHFRRSRIFIPKSFPKPRPLEETLIFPVFFSNKTKRIKASKIQPFQPRRRPHGHDPPYLQPLPRWNTMNISELSGGNIISRCMMG